MSRWLRDALALIQLALPPSTGRADRCRCWSPARRPSTCCCRGRSRIPLLAGALLGALALRAGRLAASSASAPSRPETFLFYAFSGRRRRLRRPARHAAQPGPRRPVVRPGRPQHLRPVPAAGGPVPDGGDHHHLRRRHHRHVPVRPHAGPAGRACPTPTPARASRCWPPSPASSCSARCSTSCSCRATTRATPIAAARRAGRAADARRSDAAGQGRT